MYDLENRDIGALRTVLADLESVNSPDSIVPFVVPRLAQIVGAEIGTSNVFDELSSHNEFTVWPHGAMNAADHAAYRTYTMQQPLLRHYRDTGRSLPTRFSDIISQERFRRLELYEYFYRPVGINYQVAVGIPSAVGQVQAIALSRSTSDFTERAISILTWIQPRLMWAWHQTRERIQEKLFGCAVESLMTGAGEERSLILVDRYLNVKLLFGGAVELLEPRQDVRLRRPLPPLLASLVSAAREQGVAVVSLDGTKAVSTISARVLDDLVAIVVQCRKVPELALIRSLTARQRETLIAVALHSSNQAVARALSISPKTVSRHMEEVHRKLGVRDRTAAVRILLTSGHI